MFLLNKKQISGYQGWGEREWEVTANGYGIFLWGDKNVLKLDIGDS